MKKWTVKSLESLPASAKLYTVSEGNHLYMKVHPSGRKTFHVYYVSPVDGRRRWYPLGRWPYRSLAKAREERDRILSEIAEKNDPLLEEERLKNQNHLAPTVKQLAAEYLEKHAKVNKKSWREDQRWLTKDILPNLGEKKAKDVRRRDLIDILDQIQADSTRGVTARKHVLATTRRMFSWALSRDVVEINPCSGIEVYKPDPRVRAVRDKEILALWYGMKTVRLREDLKRILRILLLTGQRNNEVAGAHWSEFDGNWWIIPPSRTKNKRSHRVYLTGTVQKLFGNPGTGFVFPAPRDPAKPVSNFAVTKGMAKVTKAVDLEDLKAHDLRKAVASGLSRLGIDKVIRDLVQNWVDSSVSARHYDTHDFDREKADALSRWEKEVLRILSEEQNMVIEFPR